jgi:long-chain acyl-CoA synthetase
MSGKEITQFYGFTEGGQIMTVDSSKSGRRNGSVGKTVSGMEIRILDQEGQEAPAGEAGEVCFRFEGHMVGYWNLPEETGKTLREGWLHTGDIGTLDKDGFLFLLDRKQDRMLVGGYNVYPSQIEEVLHKDKRVKEAAVIGIPDERLGEVPIAFVVLKEGEKATEEELINLTREELAKYKALRKVRFVESIPKNPTGKILKKLLKEKMGNTV